MTGQLRGTGDEADKAIALFNSARRRSNAFRIEDAHLASEIVEQSSEERERRARAAQAESVAKRMESENNLREILGSSALRYVKWQLIVCNSLVIVYLVYLMWNGMQVPTEVVITWMSATTAEIIGILWVIARSLFPFRDEGRERQLERRTESDGSAKCEM